MSRKILLAVVFALAIFPLFADDAFAFNAAAGDSVVNGRFASSDTIPYSAGVVSIHYTAAGNSTDTKYAGPYDSPAMTIRKAMDMDTIGTPADASINAGETATFPYWIKNQGNATVFFALSCTYTSPAADTAGQDWGGDTSRYGIVVSLNSDSVIDAGESASLFYPLAPGQSKIAIAYIFAVSTRSDRDSTYARIVISDNADSITSTQGDTGAGDAWADSQPQLSGNIDFDTQVDIVWALVTGPNIYVSKTYDTRHVVGSQIRPGDTILYYLTLDNDGSGACSNVIIMDAVPTNTKYLVNSADSLSNASTPWGETTHYKLTFADTLAAQSFSGVQTNNARVIRWELQQQLVADSAGGDAYGTVNFGTDSDNVRAEFAVQVN